MAASIQGSTASFCAVFGNSLLGHNGEQTYRSAAFFERKVCKLTAYGGIRSGRTHGVQLLKEKESFMQGSKLLAPVKSLSRLSMSVGTGTVVTEPATGIHFAPSFTVPGSSKEVVLLAAGVREKKIAIINVKVYAVGFYAESSVYEHLKDFKGKSGQDLEKDQGFYTAVKTAPVEKTMELVLARDVDRSQFLGALEESVKPKLKASNAGAAGDEALATFGKAFDGRTLKKNTGIYLSWIQPSTLEVAFADDATTLEAPTSPGASIESIHLVDAIFENFLGPDGSSPSAKKNLAEGFAKA
eukprot:jgi/Mesen1/8314/ME000457S07512